MSNDNSVGKKPNTELIVCGIPTELKKRFKVMCTEKEVSMSEVLVRMIQIAVEGKLELK